MSLCKMGGIETPTFSHILKQFRDLVYEPSEDTFLLIDAIEEDLPNIRLLRPTIVVEIGSGSGVVITALATCLGNSTFYIATDVNDNASRATVHTAAANGTSVEAVVTDLVMCLRSALQGLVDILIFNPPYVVTSENEVGGRALSAAWSGGKNGRDVMNRLFPVVNMLLSQSGVFYLVFIKENDKDDIKRVMSSYGFDCQLLKSRKAGHEHLGVLKFFRK